MSFFDVLDEMQTSFVMMAALIPGGHNKQLKGHLQGHWLRRYADDRCIEQWCDKGRSESS